MDHNPTSDTGISIAELFYAFCMQIRGLLPKHSEDRQILHFHRGNLHHKATQKHNAPKTVHEICVTVLQNFAELKILNSVAAI